jgi:hypothetical protein
MHSYILAGIRTGPLVRLLRKHGFSPNLKNLGRLLFLFQNALWSSLLAWREKKTFGETIVSIPPPDDPVIIIGHWRTGSTFLQQLLALDDQMISPTVFQASFPDSFLVSARYFRPVFSRMVKKRPMDNVRLGFDVPQEDEFALAKLSPDSPLVRIVFPKGQTYLLNDTDDFYPRDERKETWKKQFLNFCTRVRMNSGKILLLKNPVHSLRIPLLRETFPHARFIYIHRHPFEVVPSSLHLWKVMADDNQLKGKPYHPSLEEVTEGLIKFYEIIERDLALIPRQDQCSVNYESLKTDPVAEVKKIYDKLGLNFSPDLEKNLTAHLEKEKDFKKNSYNFDDDQKARVFKMMQKQFKQFQYAR